MGNQKGNTNNKSFTLPPLNPFSFTMPNRKNGKSNRNRKTKSKFFIQCSAPVADGIFDPDAFITFLQGRIKVDNQVNNLGDKIKVEREGTKVKVTAAPPFSKRYLKYLTKKYLKKQNLRDYLRVVANEKNSYELKYFSIDNAGEESEEEADE